MRNEVAACLSVPAKCVQLGATETTQGRHVGILALGPASPYTETSAQMVSLVLLMDYFELSGSAENLSSFQRVLVQDLASSLYVDARRLRLLGIRQHTAATETQEGKTTVDLFISDDILAGNSSAEHVAQSLVIQAADARSPLRSAQLTSPEILLQVNLHGQASQALGGINASAIAMDGDAYDQHSHFRGPEMTGRELRRELLHQSRDPKSMLNTQTAITYVKALPHGLSSRKQFSPVENLLVGDGRTSAAVQRLGMQNDLLLEPAMESMLALCQGSVDMLGETMSVLMHSPNLNLHSFHPVDGYVLDMGRKGSFQYGSTGGEEGLDTYSETPRSALKKQASTTEDESSHYTPSYTPRDRSYTPYDLSAPQEALKDEKKTQMKNAPVHETFASLDSYDSVRADDIEDAVLVFDLDFDDIYGQEAEFADEVTAHMIRALGGDNVVIDPGWIKVTKLKRGSIRVYVKFGRGLSCGGRGGGISAEEAIARLHQQALSEESLIKSGDLGSRLKGLEVNSTALDRASFLLRYREGGGKTSNAESAINTSPSQTTPRDMRPLSRESTQGVLGSARTRSSSRDSRRGLGSQASLMNLFFELKKTGSIDEVGSRSASDAGSNRSVSPRRPSGKSNSPLALYTRREEAAELVESSEVEKREREITVKDRASRASIDGIRASGKSARCDDDVRNPMRDSTDSLQLDWNKPLYHDRMRDVALEDRLHAMDESLRVKDGSGQAHLVVVGSESAPTDRSGSSAALAALASGRSLQDLRRVTVEGDETSSNRGTGEGLFASVRSSASSLSSSVYGPYSTAGSTLYASRGESLASSQSPLRAGGSSRGAPLMIDRIQSLEVTSGAGIPGVLPAWDRLPTAASGAPSGQLSSTQSAVSDHFGPIPSTVSDRFGPVPSAGSVFARAPTDTPGFQPMTYDPRRATAESIMPSAAIQSLEMSRPSSSMADPFGCIQSLELSRRPSNMPEPFISLPSSGSARSGNMSARSRPGSLSSTPPPPVIDAVQGSQITSDEPNDLGLEDLYSDVPPWGRSLSALGMLPTTMPRSGSPPALSRNARVSSLSSVSEFAARSPRQTSPRDATPRPASITLSSREGSTLLPEIAEVHSASPSRPSSPVSPKLRNSRRTTPECDRSLDGAGTAEHAKDADDRDRFRLTQKTLPQERGPLKKSASISTLSPLAEGLSANVTPGGGVLGSPKDESEAHGQGGPDAGVEDDMQRGSQKSDGGDSTHSDLNVAFQPLSRHEIQVEMARRNREESEQRRKDLEYHRELEARYGGREHKAAGGRHQEDDNIVTLPNFRLNADVVRLDMSGKRGSGGAN